MFGTSSHVVVLHHLRWMLVHITITSLLSYRSIGYNDHPSGCIPKGSRVKWSKARKCFTPCMRCECLHLSSRCEAPFRISVALEWGGHRLAKCCSHRTLPKRGIRPSREWSEHPRLPNLFFKEPSIFVAHDASDPTVSLLQVFNKSGNPIFYVFSLNNVVDPASVCDAGTKSM